MVKIIKLSEQIVNWYSTSQTYNKLSAIILKILLQAMFKIVDRYMDNFDCLIILHIFVPFNYFVDNIRPTEETENYKITPFHFLLIKSVDKFQYSIESKP